MRDRGRLVTVILSAFVILAGPLIGPATARAHDRPGDTLPRPHHRPVGPVLRPLPARPLPVHPFPGRPFPVRPHPFRPLSGLSCCLGVESAPPEPPPVIVTAPPPIYLVVPSPPSLVYVPTPRVEPAPEITLPTGRWARHGNGVDYPYVWVWVGPAAER